MNATLDLDALPPMAVAGRADRLRAALGDAGCDALLVTRLTNVRYLTGFTGSAGVLLVTAHELVLVTATHRALADTIAASLRGMGTGRGHFPQVSDEIGIRVVGTELESVHVGGKAIVENGAVVDPDATIVFVTLSYLARGGDGWFEGHADSLEVTPLGITEQDALAGFLAAQIEGGTWDEGRRYATAGTRIVREDQ